MNKLIDKTYMVIGASSGIGKGIAEYLTQELGANVVLVARRKEIITELAQNFPGKNMAISCDIRELERIGDIFSECERAGVCLDGIVYSAGVAPLCALKDNDAENVLDTIKVNALGFAEVAKYLLNTKCVVKGASVVAISSVVSQVTTNRQSTYASSKAMLNTYVKYFAKEALGKMRVNAVLPGIVETEMYERLREQSENLDEKTKKNQPMGIIPIDRVAKLVAFLLSDDSDYMTGSLVFLDGGFLLR